MSLTANKFKFPFLKENDANLTNLNESSDDHEPTIIEPSPKTNNLFNINHHSSKSDSVFTNLWISSMQNIVKDSDTIDQINEKRSAAKIIFDAVISHQIEDYFVKLKENKNLKDENALLKSTNHHLKLENESVGNSLADAAIRIELIKETFVDKNDISTLSYIDSVIFKDEMCTKYLNKRIESLLSERLSEPVQNTDTIAINKPAEEIKLDLIDNESEPNESHHEVKLDSIGNKHELETGDHKDQLIEGINEDSNHEDSSHEAPINKPVNEIKVNHNQLRFY